MAGHVAGRLEAVEPFLHTWLGHQTRDAYWRHGSVCEDYGAMDAAVLAVGGRHDPVPRHGSAPGRAFAADRVRGLVGPWSHQYPDRGPPPGPAIGFLQETPRRWDHWRKDEDTGVMSEPLLRSYVSDSRPPATVYPTLPGRWVGEPAWPSPHVRPVTYAFQGAPVLVRSPIHTGIDAGRSLPFGNDADLPPDQWEEDARSACFEFEVGEDTWVLWRPRVRLRLSSEVPRGQVVARLCDVAPDGSSTLVPRGVLNLTARHGRDHVVLDEPRPERLVVRDVAKGEWHLEVDPRHGGTRVHPDGLEFTEDALETYAINESDPLSARTRSDRSIRLHRPEAGWDTTVRTRSEISYDRHDFTASHEAI